MECIPLRACRRWIALAAACALIPVATAGSGRLEVLVGQVAGEGWGANGVAVAIEIDPGRRLTAIVTAASLDLPDPVGRLEGLRAECGAVQIEGSVVRCEGLSVADAVGSIPPVTGGATYDRADGSVVFDLKISGSAGGRLAARGRLSRSGWRASFSAQDLPLADVPPWLPLPAAAGVLDGTATLAGRGGGLDRADFDVRLKDFEASSEDGTIAVAGVGLRLVGRAAGEGEALGFEARVETAGGEAYVEPVYADLATYPLRLELDGRWDGSVLEIGSRDLEHAGVLAGEGRAWLEPGPEGWKVAAGFADVREARLPGAYAVLVQPFLAGTGLADLDTRGRLAAQASVADGRVVFLSVRLEDLDVDDRGGRLALYGLTGDLSWAPRATDVPVRPVGLAWNGGFLHGVSIGAGRLDFTAGPGGWSLKGPARIPVLDGALVIRAFEMGDFTEGNARMGFDAELEPLDMRGLARALGWPPMSGTLSGTLPELKYENGDLTIGGVLEARVFDGRVRVGQFRVRDPFQEGSLLRAELDLDGLDLEQLTEAFSFGRITGTLDGYVHGLEIIGGSVEAFDARLFTPQEDARRHRISQRAVDNIASLGGGGGAAALSKGFLRFFEEFGYGEMALGCRLEKQVCRMSGVKPAGAGYYILTPRGLPRIEVVGFAGQVSWPTLVSQLKAIVESEGPVVR